MTDNLHRRFLFCKSVECYSYDSIFRSVSWHSCCKSGNICKFFFDFLFKLLYLLSRLPPVNVFSFIQFIMFFSQTVAQKSHCV